MRQDGLRNLPGAVRAQIQLQPARTRIKCGQLISLIADHRHAQCLQDLHRLRQIENRLRACADSYHRVTRQRNQIGRDVEAVRSAAMNVDSSATTPWRALTAASTEGAIETTSLKNDICSLMLTGAQA